jgi:hypothetical protein
MIPVFDAGDEFKGPNIANIITADGGADNTEYNILSHAI